MQHNQFDITNHQKEFNINDEQEKKLEEKFDFYRRLNGRLSVQYNKLTQVSEILSSTNHKNMRKVELLSQKIALIQETISEMEFIKGNFLDDIQEGNGKISFEW